MIYDPALSHTRKSKITIRVQPNFSFKRIITRTKIKISISPTVDITRIHDSRIVPNDLIIGIKAIHGMTTVTESRNASSVINPDVGQTGIHKEKGIKLVIDTRFN